MAQTAEDKDKMANQLIKRVTATGIALDDLYIDPLMYPLATNTDFALATLKAIESIMHQFPGVHTTCGLTNISCVLPNRKLVNRTFLVVAIVRGLDSAIIDPNDTMLYGARKATLMMMGKDEFCVEYVADFRKGRLE